MSEGPSVGDIFHFELPVWMVGEGVRQGKSPHSIMRLTTKTGNVLPVFTDESSCKRFIKHMGRSGKTSWKVETAAALIEVVENTGVINVAFDIQPGCEAMHYPAHMLTGWVRQRWPST